MGPERGIGHLMRCLALAEELQRRRVEVVFVCDAHTVPWAEAQLAARGIRVEPAVWTVAEHLGLFERLDAVVFDSYDLDVSVYRGVRAAGIPTLAIVDGDFRGAEADVLVDQNLAAELDRPKLPHGAVRLAGLEYVLIRDEILALRPTSPPSLQPAPSVVPKVFAFFGGTDAFGAGPYVVQALAETGVPFEATVVAPAEDLAAQIAAVELQPRQQVEVVGPTDQLAAAVRAADLTISASGTSTWELLCLGATAGLVCVVDNQVMGYERAIATGTAAGVGLLSELKEDPSAPAAVLKRLLTDQAERARLASAGWKLVDGNGRVRVADALFALT